MQFVVIGNREFQVTPRGEILKLSGKPYAAHPDSDGYMQITISIQNRKYAFKQHRLVWMLHNGSIPEGMTVDHIDGDKSNNVISNLQLLSRSENSVKGNAKHWKVTTPDGIVEYVYNLNSYCKEKGLKHGAMSLVAQGKYKQHKGYQVYAV